jgi:hypothetical protein
MKALRFLAGAALATLALGSVAADETTDRWIAKARAFLGSETALNAVNSLHFEGTFASSESIPDPADPQKTIEKPVQVGIDIVFQLPMQQRQVLRSEKFERTTVLDDYDGWEQVSELAPKGGKRLALLDAAGIKRLRATTIENLSFYGNRLGRSRTIQYVGDEQVDDVACAKLSFGHGDNMIFVRFFDKNTGRLVKTEMRGGGEIREEGEMIVQGVRFPRRVINRTANGHSTVITFEKITVNESFPLATFAVPSTQVR